MQVSGHSDSRLALVVAGAGKRGRYAVTAPRAQLCRDSRGTQVVRACVIADPACHDVGVSCPDAVHGLLSDRIAHIYIATKKAPHKARLKNREPYCHARTVTSCDIFCGVRNPARKPLISM